MSDKRIKSKSRNLETSLTNKQLAVKQPSAQAHLSFSFEHFSEKEHGLADCSADDYKALIMQLKKLGHMDWNTIISTQRHGLGSEKINENSLKAKIPLDVPKDVTLVAFRYKGKHPMVGYRDGSVFHIIFLDTDFTLYDHG